MPLSFKKAVSGTTPMLVTTRSAATSLPSDKSTLCSAISLAIRPSLRATPFSRRWLCTQEAISRSRVADKT